MIVGLPCPLAVPFVEDAYGPPPEGKRYVCSPLFRWRPILILSRVKEVDLLAGTYLIQTVHELSLIHI